MSNKRFIDPETGARETPDETYDRLMLLSRFGDLSYSYQRRQRVELLASLRGLAKKSIKLGRGQRRSRRRYNGSSATFAAMCEREWSRGDVEGD